MGAEMLRTLAGATAIGILLTVAANAQGLPDPAQQKLNSCLSMPRAAPTTQEEIFKSLNPAINDPDRVAWCLFLYVNSKAASGTTNDALFETWASDGETFTATPRWPVAAQPKQLRRNILLQVRDAERVMQLGRQEGAIRSFVLPPPRPLKDGENLEETRRNKPTFDFIVANNLYKLSGV